MAGQYNNANSRMPIQYIELDCDAVSKIFKRIKNQGILGQAIEYNMSDAFDEIQELSTSNDFMDVVKMNRLKQNISMRQVAKAIGKDDETYRQYESKYNKIQDYKIAEKIIEFKYSDDKKLEEAKQKVRQETEQEILKLIGNKILDFERRLLNTNERYTRQRYINETRNYIFNLYNFLCSLSHRGENKYKIIESKYKKQLSKQAKKEKYLEKRNKSFWDWEDEI